MKERNEQNQYFALFQGARIPFSAFKSPGIKEAVSGLLTKGELVGQYRLDKELIVYKYERGE